MLPLIILHPTQEDAVTHTPIDESHIDHYPEARPSVPQRVFIQHDFACPVERPSACLLRLIVFYFLSSISVTLVVFSVGIEKLEKIANIEIPTGVLTVVRGDLGPA